MKCPCCDIEADISEVNNKYFMGRNSNNIPIFKCASCGEYFCVNESTDQAITIKHDLYEGAARKSAFIWGTIYGITAYLIFFKPSNEFCNLLTLLICLIYGLVAVLNLIRVHSLLSISTSLLQLFVAYYTYFKPNIDFLNKGLSLSLFFLAITSILTAIKGSKKLHSEISDVVEAPLSKNANKEWSDYHDQAYKLVKKSQKVVKIKDKISDFLNKGHKK